MDNRLAINYRLSLDLTIVKEISEIDQQLLRDGKALPLMEAFYTIQGEGYHTGKAAYFVRIGGCDVGCHWCDVKESWDASLHPLTETDKIITNVLACPAKAVVVTGGEPLLYNMNYFTEKLKLAGVQTFLETSGAYELSGQWDWVCFSPKKNSPPVSSIFSSANELKIIIHNQDDFSWAEKYANKVAADCILYLQPEWSKSEEMIQKIVDYVQENPKWRISIQSHKYMHIP